MGVVIFAPIDFHKKARISEIVNSVSPRLEGVQERAEGCRSRKAPTGAAEEIRAARARAHSIGGPVAPWLEFNILRPNT